MADKEKSDCCCGGKKSRVIDGFLFGIGLSLALMASTIAVVIFSVILYYILKSFGLGF